MFTKPLITLLIGAGIGIAASVNAAAPNQSDAKLQIEKSSVSFDLIAREAGSRGRGRGRDDAKGHGHVDEETCDHMRLAREASEAPRGQDNERPGDRQRRNRGGRNRG